MELQNWPGYKTHINLGLEKVQQWNLWNVSSKRHVQQKYNGFFWSTEIAKFSQLNRRRKMSISLCCHRHSWESIKLAIYIRLIYDRLRSQTSIYFSTMRFPCLISRTLFLYFFSSFSFLCLCFFCFFFNVSFILSTQLAGCRNLPHKTSRLSKVINLRKSKTTAPYSSKGETDGEREMFSVH